MSTKQVKRAKVTIVDHDDNELGGASNPIQVTGGGGGTEYLEGDTDSSITGAAIMFEGAADTLMVPSSGNPLPVTGAVTATNLDIRDLTSVSDSVTVTGTVTANAGTNLNTSALALETTATSIKTAVETLDNAIAGSEMQVDVVTMPTTTVTATDLDIRNLAFTQDNLNVRGQALSVTAVQATASGDTTLVDPTASQQVYLYKVHLANVHATTALTVGIRFGAGSIFNKVYLPAAGGQTTIHLLPNYLSGGTNNNLIVNLSAAGTIEATAYYLDAV